MKVTFETALANLKMGKKIRRACWEAGEHMVLKEGTILYFDPETAAYYCLDFDVNDVSHGSWEVVE